MPGGGSVARRGKARIESAPGRSNGPLVLAAAADEPGYAALLDAIRVRRVRVDTLRGRLAEARRALHGFEAVCQARVGDLVAELRQVSQAAAAAQDRLESFLAAVDPADHEVLDALLEELDVELDLDLDMAGNRAMPDEETDREPGAADPFGARFVSGPSERPLDGSTRDGLAELRRLYRGLAKRCHPDLADAEADRARRATLMQRINEAYQAEDIAALRLLVQETETDAPGFAQRPLAERVRWARAELARLDRLVGDLRGELARLHASDLYRLWKRHAAGESVFTEMEDGLEARIKAEGRRLDRLTATYRRLAPDPLDTESGVGAAAR